MICEVNRSAIVVIPKQSFIDRLHFVDPEGSFITLADAQEEPTVYLIPVVEDRESLGRFLGKHCKAIFEEQLDAWITDDTLWPPDRSFEVFSRWFAVSFHSMVYDFSAKR